MTLETSTMLNWMPAGLTRPWKPTDNERDRYHDVYIDESGKSFRFMIIGGLVIPYSHAGIYQEEIVELRDRLRHPIIKPGGEPREMKWEYVDKTNVVAYAEVIEATKKFSKKHEREIKALKDVGMHCLSIDTSRKPLKKTGDGDRKIGFEKEFYFFCNNVIAGRYSHHLFSLYPDKELGRRGLKETKEILNNGAFQWGDPRKYPFRRANFIEPEAAQALQVADIFCGALHFKQNGFYDEKSANAAKCVILFLADAIRSTLPAVK
jgi:hypothetical protein